ncbi:hypothetical protein Hanom_Chr08g00720871 [Helianthus anomalus]
MAYEAKALGFKCPSCNIDAWESKLRSLGGNPVKSAAVGSSKAMEKLTGADDEAEKEVQTNPEADAGEDAMNEEGVAP